MNTIYRKELKFLISTTEFAKLKSRIRAYMKPDNNMANGFYTVRTLYFDTLSDNDLYSSVSGYMEKSKIRLRIYPPLLDNINIELKEKIGFDGLKTHVKITKKEALLLMKSQYSFLLNKNDKSALKIFNRLRTNGYFPKSIVEYKRTAYYLPASDTRITFDYDIGVSQAVTTFFKGKILTLPATENNIGVLEVKYNNILLGVIKNILKDIDNLNEANSKYVQSRLAF